MFSENRKAYVCLALVALLLQLAHSQQEDNSTEDIFQLQFSQNKIEKLIEGLTATVRYNLTGPSSEATLVQYYSGNMDEIAVEYAYNGQKSPTSCRFDVNSSRQDVATVNDKTGVSVSCGDVSEGNFTVQANFLGRTTLSFYVHYEGPSKMVPDVIPIHNEFKVSVIRKPRAIDVVFKYVVMCVIILNTIGFGASVDLQVVKEILMKPIAPIIGAVCQLIIMPLLAFCLAYFIPLDNALRLGLLTMGSSPGGGASNVWTFLLDGDITLSITMTLINTILTLGTMPLWLTQLGKFFIEEGTGLSIPYSKIVISLLQMIGPVAIGLAIRIFKPNWAQFILKILKPVCAIMVLLLITTGIYSNWYVFSVLTPLIVVAGFALPWSGFIMGGVVALITRRPWPRVKTIAIETGFQNGGIALVLLQNTFPQPDADLAAVVPVIVTILCPLPLLLIFIIRLIVGCFKRDKKSVDVSEETKDDKKEKKKKKPKPQRQVTQESYVNYAMDSEMKVDKTEDKKQPLTNSHPAISTANV